MVKTYWEKRREAKEESEPEIETLEEKEDVDE